MTARRLLLFMCLLSGTLSVRSQLPAIGGWRDHLPFQQAIGLAGSGDTVYCATPYSVFSVDLSDKSIRRFSKSSGLSETGIAAMAYDQTASVLTLAYTSSNIDMIHGSQTFNISSVLDAALSPGANRTIYAAYVLNGKVYLSTGLGIIVLDETKHEVSDTYVIGNDGDTATVWSVVGDSNYFYAATSQGVRRAPTTGVDLADYHNWDALPADGSALCRQLAIAGGQLLLMKGDSIYRRNGDTWTPWYSDAWRLVHMDVTGAYVALDERLGDKGRVLLLSSDAVVQRDLQTGLVYPMQTLAAGDMTLVADSVQGLSAWNADGNAEWYNPNSPLSATPGDMAFLRNDLWIAAGNLSTLADGVWTNYTSDTGLTVLAVNPADSSVWAAGSSGLIRRQPGDRVTRYPAGNVGGLCFDAKGNLWLTNNGAPLQLSLFQPDGTRFDFASPYSLTGNQVGQIVADDRSQLWIQSPGGNGVLCYSPGTLMTDGSDDQWKYYQAGSGQGNLPDNHVYSLAKDKSGFIWIGTGNGIGVVQCAQNVFRAEGCEAIWPVVQYDAFAGYLFSGQTVQAIAVDGADRKWIGTRNGVWLISPNAEQIVYHFTADSTPLLNNDVRKISIDPKTGDVFFATAGGLCSFRSTATQGGDRNQNVLVFPNPVPPAYGGTIAIRGLVDEAIVKITQLDGRLIYQTRALGGQAVWDGRDYKGRRVTTGVYLVLVSSDDRSEKMVTKIVFIGK